MSIEKRKEKNFLLDHLLRLFEKRIEIRALVLAAKPRGRASHLCFEYHGEILLCMKAALLADGTERQLRGEQKSFCGVDAVFLQILARSETAGLGKERVKIIGTQIHRFRNVAKSDGIGTVRSEIFLCALRDRVLVGIRLLRMIGIFEQ